MLNKFKIIAVVAVLVVGAVLYKKHFDKSSSKKE
jgi:hypothetical protein